jgi:acyl-[acyl-carrier-protein] desaturase
MHRQVTGFAMPGRELPDFREKASQIAKAGIYDLRIHHDDVLLTILFRHWKLDQLTGLTEEAEQARHGILMYLGRLDATAKKYEEKRAAADIA